MKKKILNLIIIAFVTGVTSSTCEDTDKDLSTMGKEAGKAFCDCVKKHDKDYCLEELKDDYTKSQYTSSAFISEFNDTNPCGAELEVIYLKDASGSPAPVENILIVNP
jgi:hypothetical protein